MRQEKLAGFPAAFNRHDALVDLAIAALSAPETLNAARLEPLITQLITALAFEPEAPGWCGQALGTVATLLYARPDLLAPALIEALADLLRSVPLPNEIGWAGLKIFEFLASTAHAGQAWSQLRRILRDENLDTQRRQRLLPLVSEFVDWREDIVGLDGILALARSPRLSDGRFLLDHGVDRLVFRAPEAFTVERLERIADIFGGCAALPLRPVLACHAPGRSRPRCGSPHARARGTLSLSQTAAAILEGRPAANYSWC